MKKRKAPILLISLLVIFVGGVVIYGINENRVAKVGGDTPVTGEGQDAPKDIGSSVQNNTKGSHMMQVAQAGGPANTGPSIALPRHFGDYPTPKPSSNGDTNSLRPQDAAH